jgi:hypothetical protein
MAFFAWWKGVSMKQINLFNIPVEQTASQFVSVYPREVLKPAILANSSALFFVITIQATT